MLACRSRYPCSAPREEGLRGQPPTTHSLTAPRGAVPLHSASPRPSHSAGQLGPDEAVRQACLHERLERVTLEVARAADARLVVAEVGHLADRVDVAAEPSATQRLGPPSEPTRERRDRVGPPFSLPGRDGEQRQRPFFLRPHMALACTGACGSAAVRSVDRCAERLPCDLFARGRAHRREYKLGDLRPPPRPVP